MEAAASAAIQRAEAAAAVEASLAASAGSAPQEGAQHQVRGSDSHSCQVPLYQCRNPNLQSRRHFSGVHMAGFANSTLFPLIVP
jgi:hypothetical protein